MPDPYRALDLVVTEIQNAPALNPYHELATNLINTARRALQFATTPTARKEIRNELQRAELYLQQRGERLAAANFISAERLRVERSIGELLAEQVSAGNPQFSLNGRITKLPDGINFNQSSQWQRLAEISETDFEHWLAERITREEEITTNAALAFWSEFVRKQNASVTMSAADEIISPNAPPMPDFDEEAGDDENLLHQIYCPHCGAAILLSNAAQVEEQ